MTSIKDVIFYLIKHYPSDKKDDLSPERLTKMAYLADWHQSIKFQKQITSIQWDFGDYGPLAKNVDIANEIEKESHLFDVKKSSPLGNTVVVYSIKKDSDYDTVISDNEKISLNHVIKHTKDLSFGDFIRLIYSTYPFLTSDKYSSLNLIEKSYQYKEFNKELKKLQAS